VAGRVEAVGAGVTTLRPGDEVFGTATGAWAELACAREARVAPKPPGVSFADAAAAPIAACTALQALRDHGRVESGQKVLVNGASGGVGTYAVQLAKYLGADVTAVCSTRNVELVRSLGADRVVDYTREDFTRSGERHDVYFDVAGTRSWSDMRRVLTPDAKVIVVGAPKGGKVLGPLRRIIAFRLSALRGSQKVSSFIAKTSRADMQLLADLLESGTIRTAVDRTFPFEQTADAFRYLGEGHAQGKIVITV
jgi:NADPH:quinone reductase-like Zn-dependent oxidoreductase